MNYEAPELKALTPAIDAIQSGKTSTINPEVPGGFDALSAYEDWE
jgi:hypothetical protein